jgi:hypothetical protein
MSKVWHEKCSKCKAETSHRSGVCKACRKCVCAECGANFNPYMRVEMYCSKCKSARKRVGSEARKYIPTDAII